MTVALVIAMAVVMAMAIFLIYIYVRMAAYIGKFTDFDSMNLVFYIASVLVNRTCVLLLIVFSWSCAEEIEWGEWHSPLNYWNIAIALSTKSTGVWVIRYFFFPSLHEKYIRSWISWFTGNTEKSNLTNLIQISNLML